MIEKSIVFNGLTMNDASLSGLNASPYYWIKVDAVDGLWGNDIRYESHPIPGKTGERSGDVFQSGKQLVLSGRIFARNIREMRTAQGAMMQAFWDGQPHQLQFYFWDSPQLYFTARQNQPLVMTEEVQALTHFVRSWTIGLRCDDPRAYKVSDNSLFYSWQS